MRLEPCPRTRAAARRHMGVAMVLVTGVLPLACDVLGIGEDGSGENRSIGWDAGLQALRFDSGVRPDAGSPDGARADASAAVADGAVQVQPDAALPRDAAVPPDAAVGADAAGAADAGRLDAASPADASSQPDAQMPMDASSSAPDAAGLPDAGVLVPEQRGSYLYNRLAIGGLDEAYAVAFHPDGTYAVILEYSDVVHVYDLASGTTTRFDLAPGSDTFYWEDIAFDPRGQLALLVGSHVVGTTRTGVVWRFNDSAWRAGLPQASIFTAVPGVPTATVVQAVRYPQNADPPALLFRTTNGNNNTMALRRFDDSNDTFQFLGAQATGAGCQDIAFVKNAFGETGILVACGINGYDGLYYTEVGGFAEWRLDLGNNSLGNTSRLAAHPSGDYALAICWSCDAIYRFEGELMNPALEAPRFSTRRLWGAAFQTNGQRAIIFGQYMNISGSAPFGVVFEYRHDLYRCPSPQAFCDLTEVSIANFDAPPFSATNGTRLNDAAWKPGCAGGLIVGGNGALGLVITFQVEGQPSCFP